MCIRDRKEIESRRKKEQKIREKEQERIQAIKAREAMKKEIRRELEQENGQRGSE